MRERSLSGHLCVCESLMGCGPPQDEFDVYRFNNSPIEKSVLVIYAWSAAV